MVFSVESGFLHQKYVPPRYSLNIIESGVKHHNLDPVNDVILVYMFSIHSVCYLAHFFNIFTGK